MRTTRVINFDSSDETATVFGDGGSFSVQLQPELRAINGCDVEIIEATLWNSVPNVSEGSFISLHLPAYTDPDTGALFAALDEKCVFIKGLYSVEDINDTLQAFLVARGRLKGTVALEGQYSTMRLLFTLGPNCRMVISQSLTYLLGWGVTTNSVALEAGPFVARQYTSPEIGRFDNVQYFFIRSNICDGGMELNGTRTGGVLCRIGLTNGAGYQIQFAPSNPLVLQANKLRQGLSVARFELTDERGRIVDTNGQPFSLVARFTFY